MSTPRCHRGLPRFRRSLWGWLVLTCGAALLAACAANPKGAAGRKVALVIGNAAYENAPVLVNPTNDAADMCAALRRVGANVYIGGGFINVGGIRQPRLAEVDAVTGALTAWRPNVSGDVRCMVRSGANLYVAGTFGGAAYSLIDRALLPWNPRAPFDVQFMAPLVGGMLAADLVLGITPSYFINNLPRAVMVSNLWLATGKTAVFGLLIALIGCHYGLRVKPNTESLGQGTTASVVTSITVVILVDALFAVVFKNIGI